MLPTVATQVTENASWTVAPATTSTGRGLPGATVQLGATPSTDTLWLPASTWEKSKAAFTGAYSPAPPSTLTMYPSGSSSTPVVATVTATLPVIATHVIGKGPRAGGLRVTFARRGLPPPPPPATAQFGARPERRTLWLPVLTPVKVLVAFNGKVSPAAPSRLREYPSGSRSA